MRAFLTLGGTAVFLRMDNSVSTFPIEQDGSVNLERMDLFDPAQPFWGDTVPSIKWPEEWDVCEIRDSPPAFLSR
jgi:hypothetical protein